jgi:hypothetical protein
MAVNYFRPVRDLSRRRYNVSQKIIGQDENFNRGQFLQEKFTNDSAIQSNEIKDVVISTSGTNVNHKLGKAYAGFNVIKNSTNANVYIESTTEADANKASFIRLKASAQTTISITVF